MWYKLDKINKADFVQISKWLIIFRASPSLHFLLRLIQNMWVGVFSGLFREGLNPHLSPILLAMVLYSTMIHVCHINGARY